MHPSWIEIDLEQFRKNLWTIRKVIGKSKFCLPVKANAYGHGLIRIGQAAAEEGIDCLAVSCLQEGVKLREARVSIPILVLGAIHESQIRDLSKYDLEFSISSKYKAELVAKYLEKKARVYLEIDTGMQRTGVRPKTAIELVDTLRKMGCFELVGVYSHFATSDEPDDPFAKEQLRAFKEVTDRFQGLVRHIANSGGVLYYPESHLDMVRPGLLAYGYKGGTLPCFSLKAKISYFKVVEADIGVSYGHQYRTKEQTRIVTVPVGFGDGYSRALSNLGSVLIGGRKFQISGTICMDQFMVDIGDSSAYVGDEVVLIGKQGDQEILLSEVSALCNTVPYETLCLFNERIPRIYKNFTTELTENTEI